MITKREILKIADSALKEFNLKCDIKFLPYNDFKSMAKRSPLIRQVLKEGATFKELKIPALIHHEARDHIYLSKKVLNSLLNHKNKTIQLNFVRSVIYHELFHILNEHSILSPNFMECLKSEERVCKDFGKKYPQLHKMAYNLHRKATQL
jgi:hypothetical protein